MKRILVATTSLFLLIAGRVARADDLQQYLNKEYVGKVLTLRHFYEGDHLRFLSDGNLVGTAPIGPWTIDGRIEVTQMQTENGLLEVKARRLNIIFASRSLTGQAPTPVDQLTASGKRPKKKDLRKHEVAIDIELPSASPNEREIESAIHDIFLMPGESMIDLVPPYWRPYFGELENRTQPKPERVVGRVGGGISPPRVIYSPDPQYSDNARKAKYQGTVVLWLVVDPNGRPRDLHIVKPLGLGLDERAVEAVSNWNFHPAQKSGTPVAVEINVEVTFRLY